MVVVVVVPVPPSSTIGLFLRQEISFIFFKYFDANDAQRKKSLYAQSVLFFLIIMILIGSFRSVFFVWIDLVYALYCTVDLFVCCV